MPKLTDYSKYSDALAHFSKAALWQLFDGDRKRLNIATECVDRHPREKVAIRIAHATGGNDVITFGELSDRSNQFADFLIKSGVAKGDRVALMLEPSLIFYVALFGAMKAGAVAVPLFTLFGPDGLRLRIDDCHPKILLITPEKRAVAPQMPDLQVVVANDEFIDGLRDYDVNFSVDTRADDMAMYQYTSGTTRELPEAVKHRHHSVVTVMIAALYGTGVRPGDNFMCPSSPAWGHGLWHGTIAPLALGVNIAAYAGKFNPARLLQALRDFKINNFSAAATHFRMIKNANLIDGHDFNITKLTFTGEPMDSDTGAWARETFNTPVCSMYGSTEVGVILVDYPGASDYLVKPGSLGRPVPGVELAVHDAHGAPCPPGVIGEIMVKRRDGWFPTKDRGHTDADGYFYHDGRADDVIISAGWTMSAVEIEDILLKHPKVNEAAVIGVPDQERGQIVKAFIVSTDDTSDELIKELQTFTRTRLSQHEYPRVISFVPDLPKTPAGKVNRRVLRAREAGKILK